MLDHEPARRFYEASMAIHDSLGNRRGVAICLNNLARLAYELGDLEDGARLFAQSLELRQALQDRRGMSISLNGLGMVALHRGDLPAARDFHTRSLSIQRELGDRPSAAESLLSLGAVAATAGDAALARRLIEEGLTLQRQVGDGLSMVNAIEACLVLATAERQWERVLRLEGLGRVYRATTHFPRIPVDEARIGAFVGAAEREVGPERAREVLAEGAALDVRGALAEAVGP
jgi:tetratricopeptide (TPR) repeat protein